jgi:molybdopterin-guanine dinucleotide biosynthesis protein A
MGSDKAALNFSGQTLLARAMAAMQSVVDNVFVSARGEQQSSAGREAYPFIADSLGPDVRGPAAGILSAHCAHPDAAWLVLAVDMPLVTAAVLKRLLSERSPDHAATAWRSDHSDAPEPLCAVYEPATLAGFLHQVLAGGDSSPQRWLSAQRVKLLDGSDSGLLAGANTPQELDLMLADKRGGQEQT